MGYTTEFEGQIKITPPLSTEERGFLLKFSETRRMNRKNGPYFVNGGGDMGQARDADIIDYNLPPTGQPSLWCGWMPDKEGKHLIWNGVEKFYEADEWMKYLMHYFTGSNPKAKSVLPFLTGHICNGEILAQGEDIKDRWKLIVKDNKVSVEALA